MKTTRSKRRISLLLPRLEASSALVALAVTSSSCMLLMPKKEAPRNRKPKIGLCELKPGVDRLVFMPYGKYDALSPSGHGDLNLNKDHTYFFSFTNNRSNVEVQFRGTYEWKKQGIGEVFNICGGRQATENHVRQASMDSSTAVLGIRHDPPSFKISWPRLGEITFDKR